MKNRRLLSLIPAAIMATLALVGTSARADDFAGHVRSVAKDGKSIVVRETGTNRDFTLEVSGRTAIKTSDGRDLLVKDLRPGDGVGITHRGGAASKITVNVGPETASASRMAGHIKSVANDGKTIVVTETGTNKPYTLEVSGRTVIETADGRALLVKELRPGDGVGINYRGGSAARITVNPKP